MRSASHVRQGYVPVGEPADCPPAVSVARCSPRTVTISPMICRASSSMVANVDRRPGANDDVLVAVLARAHAEVNRPSASSWMVPAFWATAEVVPHRGTVRVGDEHDALGGVRDAEQRLGVGRVALLVQPREAVVAGRDEVEADLLGPDGVGDGLLSMRLAKLG